MEAEVLSKPGGLLPTLPNEVLVRIFLNLDPSSLLSVRNSCHRFRLIASDPICWPTAIVWEGCRCASDVSKLNLVLHLAKSVLKEISVSFLYPFSNCIDSILTCNVLDRVSVHNIACTRAQLQKLLSLPLLSYLHVDQLDDQQPQQLNHRQCFWSDLHLDRLNGPDRQSVGVQLLEIVEASGCKLKTLSFKSYFEFSTIEKWVALKCSPRDLRIAIVSLKSIPPHSRFPEHNYIDVLNLLRLQPVIEHEAYLSLYDFAFGSFASSHPYLQFHFTPNPSLALVHYPNPSRALVMDRLPPSPKPLVLTSRDLTSKKFSCAGFCTDYSTMDYSTAMEAKFEFSDISNDLTALRLSDLRILPSTLTAIAQMCPNLQHLDLSACYHTLNNMTGMSAVATNCPKLRVLNMSGQKQSWVWELDRLWTILQSMSSLQALFIPYFFMGTCSEPVSMPQLTNLHLLGDSSDDYKDGTLNLLLMMPSLKVLKCTHSGMEHSGISKCLHSPLKLTHFYLETCSKELSLPDNSSCYLHLQKFFLECRNFVVSNALMDAMSQSKELRVLAFRVKSVSANGVSKLITSPPLSIFHIQTAFFESGGRSYTDVTGFLESMKGIMRRKGKFIDLKIDICSSFSKVACPEHFKWFPF